MVLLGTLVVLLLTETSLFIFALLLNIFTCRFRSEALILSVISESITRSAIASLVAAVIAVTALTVAVIPAITLAAFHTRTTLSVKSASLRSAITHASSVCVLSALAAALTIAALTIITVTISVVTIIAALTTIVLSTIITVLSVIILTVTTLAVVSVVTVIVLRSVRRSVLCCILRCLCLSCLCLSCCGILCCLFFYRCLCRGVVCGLLRLLSSVSGYHIHTGGGRRRGQRFDGTYRSLCLYTVTVGIILVSASLSLIRALSAGVSLSLSVLTALTLSGHLGILRVAYEDNFFLFLRLILTLILCCGLLHLICCGLCCFLCLHRLFFCRSGSFCLLCRGSLLFVSQTLTNQRCRILFQRALCCLSLNSFFL